MTGFAIVAELRASLEASLRLRDLCQPFSPTVRSQFLYRSYIRNIRTI